MKNLSKDNFENKKKYMVILGSGFGTPHTQSEHVELAENEKDKGERATSNEIIGKLVE